MICDIVDHIIRNVLLDSKTKKGVHSILDIVLVLVLFGTRLSLECHVLCRLPIQEGQEALHFWSFDGDSDCTLAREQGFSDEFEFGGLLPGGTASRL